MSASRPLIHSWDSDEWRELQTTGAIAKEVARTFAFLFARAVRAKWKGLSVETLTALEPGDTRERQIALSTLCQGILEDPKVKKTNAETLARVMADQDPEIAISAKASLLGLRFSLRLTSKKWEETLGKTFNQAANANHLPDEIRSARYNEVNEYLKWESQQPHLRHMYKD